MGVPPLGEHGQDANATSNEPMAPTGENYSLAPNAGSGGVPVDGFRSIQSFSRGAVRGAG